VSHLGGSNSADLRIRRTLERSHSGTRGLTDGVEFLKDLIKLERLELNDKEIPSTGLIAEVIEVL
jgi:hypothetical protein